MSVLINRPDNVRRPPDWRWQRACALADGDRISPGRDDEYVKFAAKFRRLMGRCTSDRAKLAALDAHPTMYEAYAVYSQSDARDDTRWCLEARVLSRESSQNISRKTMLQRAVLDLYCKIFFDVEDRLSAPSVITHVVIKKAAQMGLAERDHDGLWKLFGYWLGPVVLDALIYDFNLPSQAEGKDGYRPSLRETSKDAIELKNAITLLTTPVGWQTRELIVNLWKDMMAMELQAGQSGVGDEIIVQRVDVMMQSFCTLFEKHRPGVDADAPAAITQFEQNGVRLRAAELAAIGMGEKPTGLEHLMTATFPEQGEDQND